jgi:hypothetical protein
MKTKLLIVLRAGAGSLHRAWTRVCAGQADVAISLYDDLPVEEADFVVTHRCAGGKYRGLEAFFRDNAWVLDAYTHFWLFEDDLYLPLESLLTVQEILERYQFVLCSPSLAPESFMAWPITVQNSAFTLRATDFVEIMAPIMSAGFLQRVLPQFGENHSGWGYEWLWRRALSDMGTFAAILDAAPVVHTRPSGSGTLYKTADGQRIRPLREAGALFEKYGIVHNAWPFRNYCGLRRDDRRLVCGAEFLALAMEGYAALLRYRPDDHQRCRDFLTGAPPALTSAEDILAFKGGVALFSAARPSQPDA